MTLSKVKNQLNAYALKTKLTEQIKEILQKNFGYTLDEFLDIIGCIAVMFDSKKKTYMTTCKMELIIIITILNNIKYISLKELSVYVS